ncbi:sirohydrochlorin cobaltochelatase [Kitasatospora sp. MAA19]|uniref:sirohydrochlorin chelatase n=1 Tax=unclassified Kitasatospora TaxID=2633591 RepID=UPI0024743AE5|nr:cobalamin biosynthesis protein CbiX [Kitasatospora sp. MAA19]MDH6707619.1 sirohydrochlorin cobaltochelatase [Kitasatospora sp. MAA19]
MTAPQAEAAPAPAQLSAAAPVSAPTAPVSTTAVVLAGGHESDGGRDLAALVEREPAVHAAAAAGRALGEAVRSALAATDGPVCVVPMTLGRDPKLVADTARALRWLAAGEGRGRLALTEPFGGKDHLVGWLRAAASAGPQRDGAVLVTAPAAGPFEDADLFRIARLVRQYGNHRWVEVAFAGGDPDPAEGAERCRLLGAREVTAVPASFGPALRTELPGVRDGGPLLRPAAIAGVVAARTAAALHLLGHGEDGILAGLDAEHGHGYAHSHGPGGDHTHGHGHGHGHGDSHGHGDNHGHSHSHSHGQGHGHTQH